MRVVVPGGGPQRTENMPRMVVTREVSQLEMSALKSRQKPKSSLMSVMRETSESAMVDFCPFLLVCGRRWGTRQADAVV